MRCSIAGAESACAPFELAPHVVIFVLSSLTKLRRVSNFATIPAKSVTV